MKLSIVIPCYNEEHNISTLLERISNLQKYSEIEFVLVDNGSTDNTGILLEQAAIKYSNIRKVKVLKNKGYGYGIKCGIKECSGDFIGWTHADSQVNPEDVLIAYNYIEKEDFSNIFFKGIRNNLKRSVTERFFTFMMQRIVSNILKMKMIDINGQPNVYPRKMKDLIMNAPDDVMIEIYCYYIALQLGLKETRKIVKFGKRLSGKSHLAPNLISRIKTSFSVIKYSKALKDRDALYV